MTNSQARLYRIILPVPDIEQAAGFYSALFSTPGQRVSPGRHYFECGGVILACYDPVTDGDGEQGGWRFHPQQYLYLAVPNSPEEHLDHLINGWYPPQNRVLLPSP